MQAFQLVLIMLSAVASAAPGDRGNYIVPGLGERKQAITGAGGGTLDLALAMLETETMTTDYAYGMFGESYAPTLPRWCADTNAAAKEIIR